MTCPSDGGNSIYSTYDLGTTTSPASGSHAAYCISGDTCTYRLRAVFDGGESLFSAWLTAD